MFNTTLARCVSHAVCIFESEPLIGSAFLSVKHTGRKGPPPLSDLSSPGTRQRKARKARRQASR